MSAVLSICRLHASILRRWVLWWPLPTTLPGLLAAVGRTHLVPVLRYAGQHGSVTSTVVQQQLGVSKPTATRYLCELGYLQKSGPAGPERSTGGLAHDWLTPHRYSGENR